ncbi:MAG: AmmeMemoRadiSam system protein B [Alphaproteobacteria bacterium]
MTRIRPAAIAGTFYPGDAAELDRTVTDYLNAALRDAGPARGRPVPKAIIAPHAGHIYSGRAAADAYIRFAPARKTITRVILMGPCHRVAVRGLATTSADSWETPLGRVPIDRASIAAVSDLPFITEHDTAHTQEHSLEVHLPFLQKLLPSFSLVPFAVGQATNEEVSQVLETLWGGPETAIVISSDLSHFLPCDAAREIDGKTAAAIEAFDWRAIGRDQACGRVPISGLLTSAENRHMKIDRVALCNSGDTAGPKDRVVGYGAWTLSEQ